MRTSSTWPLSISQIHPPSQNPLLGGALKLHGHPQSQLHAISTLPLTPHPIGLSLSAGPRHETTHCHRLVVERVERDEQLHHPEKPLAAGAQVHEAQIAASLAHVFELRRHHADAGAV